MLAAALNLGRSAAVSVGTEALNLVRKAAALAAVSLPAASPAVEAVRAPIQGVTGLAAHMTMQDYGLSGAIRTVGSCASQAARSTGSAAACMTDLSQDSFSAVASEVYRRGAVQPGMLLAKATNTERFFMGQPVGGNGFQFQQMSAGNNMATQSMNNASASIRNAAAAAAAAPPPPRS
ncbi:hypothetical protein MRY87_13580 [bacterium]|nr:hypothetical protein [bacterium]